MNDEHVGIVCKPDAKRRRLSSEEKTYSFRHLERKSVPDVGAVVAEGSERLLTASLKGNRFPTETLANTEPTKTLGRAEVKSVGRHIARVFVC